MDAEAGPAFNDAGLPNDVLADALLAGSPDDALPPDVAGLVAFAASTGIGLMLWQMSASGADQAEMVDVLVGVVPVVGIPCVVAAAPKLALALGVSVDTLFSLHDPSVGQEAHPGQPALPLHARVAR